MLPWLLLDTKKLPKMGQNSIKSSFFARRAKKALAEGQRPPQELEVGPRSGPYLLVISKGTAALAVTAVTAANATAEVDLLLGK